VQQRHPHWWRLTQNSKIFAGEVAAEIVESHPHQIHSAQIQRQLRTGDFTQNYRPRQKPSALAWAGDSGLRH
jgi:hypothetical protein